MEGMINRSAVTADSPLAIIVSPRRFDYPIVRGNIVIA